MGKDYLYKNDTMFVIYDKIEDDDYYSIYITSIKEGGNCYGSWKDFQPELDELDIYEANDECWCQNGMNREELSEELRNRGFAVIYGEDY